MMTSYPIYKSIQAANKLLASQKNISTSFLVKDLCFGKKRIIFDSLQHFADVTDFPLSILLHDRMSPLRDGVTINDITDNVCIVLHNSDIRSRERLKWTQAHEIGHIMLNHKGESDTEEFEANVFAAQLLMPWFTIRMMGNLQKPSADHIAKTFGVSITAANHRIMDVQRITCAPTALDKKIWDSQRKYIQEERREKLPIEILDKIIAASNR